MLSVVKSTDAKSVAITLASIAIVIASLSLAKSVLVPITLAVLLTFCLSPACSWLERMRISRTVAVLITAVLAFTSLGIVAWATIFQISELAPRIPEYQQNIERRFETINSAAVDVLGRFTNKVNAGNDQVIKPLQTPVALGTLESPFSVQVVPSPTSPLLILGSMYSRLLQVAGATGIVIVLVVFFLMRREDLRDRFIHLVGKGQVTLTTQMLEDAGKRISRYLSTLLLINMAFGICVYVGLVLIGVPNAMLWGVLAMVLRFVPYIGPWVAAALPLALSLAISTSWSGPLLTCLLFVSLELFNNNILEPWIYGRNTGVSAVAVLLAAVFWMWLWGPVGLLLATPLTVCILVVGKHVPQLAFLETLLGTEAVFEPSVRIYQRLLAGDQDEASELLEEFAKGKPLTDAFDTLLVPALVMADRHWRLGELNQTHHEFILQSLDELARELVDFSKQSKASELKSNEEQTNTELSQTLQVASERANLCVVCVPSRTLADELTSLMASQVLSRDERNVTSLKLASLETVEMEFDQAVETGVVIVSATPPAALMHARHICKRIRNRLPKANLVVGLWGSKINMAMAKERIGCEANLAGTLAEVDLILQRLL
jgi:predicted PurR-regulated permease PerM